MNKTEVGPPSIDDDIIAHCFVGRAAGINTAANWSSKSINFHSDNKSFFTSDSPRPQPAHGQQQLFSDLAIMMSFKTLALVAATAIVSSTPAVFAQPTLDGNVAQVQLPAGMQFEQGLTTDQQFRIAAIVNRSPAQSLSSGSCSAKTACYAATCWIPFVGVACLACDNIDCGNGRRDVGSPMLPPGIHFEEGLTADQQIRLSEIVNSPVQSLSSGSCAAKTACYAATCWIPFVGVACLACDNIQC